MPSTPLGGSPLVLDVMALLLPMGRLTDRHFTDGFDSSFGDKVRGRSCSPGRPLSDVAAAAAAASETLHRHVPSPPRFACAGGSP